MFIGGCEFHALKKNLESESSWYFRDLKVNKGNLWIWYDIDKTLVTDDLVMVLGVHIEQTHRPAGAYDVGPDIDWWTFLFYNVVQYYLQLQNLYTSINDGSRGVILFTRSLFCCLLNRNKISKTVEIVKKKNRSAHFGGGCLSIAPSVLGQDSAFVLVATLNWSIRRLSCCGVSPYIIYEVV
ncbi:hypothetical protein AGLY_010722 [Aphis glycines]|uniref:Uncharacterized protein n=1 Tax=Aphis glycines TaxID=307491 RepID=A0A6G0TEE0_APHGL|nr:hypothetical protein AGLY_010722 [Aphis glycines]